MWAVRVSLDYVSLGSEVVTKIAAACERLVIYEHEADEEINRTHTHWLVVNPTVTDETIKNWIGRHKGKGNSFWSFKTTYTVKGVEYPVDFKFITYMSKGVLHPQFVKGFTEEQIEEYRKAWIDYPSRSPVNTEHEDAKNTVTMYTMAREVHESFRYKKTKISVQQLIDPDEYQDTADGYTDPAEPYREYCKRAIQIHHKYQKGFCSYSLEKVVQTAFAMRKDNRDTLVEKMCKKFYD